MGWRSFLVAVVVALSLGAGLAFLIDRPHSNGRTAVPLVAQDKTPAVGGPFTLIDQTGRTVTDKDFLGRYMLVSFGFTYCPDVCPRELQVISAALDSLGGLANRVQALFVTVDPERDTTDVLASYLAPFGSRILGLTGTPEQISQAMKAYRVYAAKDTRNAGAAGYTMRHSTTIYLMDDRGRFVDHFSYGTTPEVMAERLQKYLSTPGRTAARAQ